MRVLVVGSGGREHALCWRLAKDAEVFAAPGNPGMAEDCECVPIPASEHAALATLCRERSVDLVVVGPEDPLVAGLADDLREQGLTVYGPGREGAQLEGSKAFAKELMERAGVPTALHRTFSDPREAKEYAASRFSQGRAVAVKASGNALGKGVIVSSTLEEAHEAIDRMLVHREFGEAGATVVIEDRLSGREFSLLTIVGDHNFVSLPIAQDYKRVFDGDQGPNTGGMGAYSPVDWVPVGLAQEVEERVVAPVLLELKRRGIAFRGTLFSGMMMDQGVPHCLEFNVRFGDPETQTLMPRMGDGFLHALRQAAAGDVVVAPEVLPNCTVSVIVASGGYPGAYAKGHPIAIEPLPDGVKVFHAGTAMREGRLVTSGGRVACVTASAGSIGDARQLAYEGAKAVRFEGAMFRSDIAAR